MENTYVLYVQALVWARKRRENRARCNTEDHLNDSFSNNDAQLIVPQESNFNLTKFT